MAYSTTVDQLMNKNYVVRKPTKIYIRAVEDKKNVIGTAKPGTSVGVVQGWVGGTRGEDLWLQFLTSANQPYYVKVDQGQADTQSMVDQGVKTVAQQTAAENPDDKSETMQLIEKTLKYAGFGLLGFLIFKTLVNKN